MFFPLELGRSIRYSKGSNPTAAKQFFNLSGVDTPRVKPPGFSSIKYDIIKAIKFLIKILHTYTVAHHPYISSMHIYLQEYLFYSMTKRPLVSKSISHTARQDFSVKTNMYEKKDCFIIFQNENSTHQKLFIKSFTQSFFYFIVDKRKRANKKLQRVQTTSYRKSCQTI